MAEILSFPETVRIVGATELAEIMAPHLNAELEARSPDKIFLCLNALAILVERLLGVGGNHPAFTDFFEAARRENRWINPDA